MGRGVTLLYLVLSITMALQSKTVIGLLVLLVTACFMAAIGKLTPEMVDVIKWVGTSYMAVRGIANYAENKVK